MLLDAPLFNVTLAVAGADELPTECSGTLPGLILVADLDLGSGSEASLNHLCNRFSGVPVVILANELSMLDVRSTMKAGAAGHLLRDISPAALQHSLKLVVAGENVLPSDLVRLLLSGIDLAVQTDQLPTGISNSDRAILSALAQGHPNKTIASSLNISEATVKQQIKAIFRKIGARNRTEAAIWALNHGLNGAGQS